MILDKYENPTPILVALGLLVICLIVGVIVVASNAIAILVVKCLLVVFLMVCILILTSNKRSSSRSYLPNSFG